MDPAPRITVVKIGGASAIALTHVCADIAALRAAGEQVVVVHGGSADIEVLATQLGVRAQTLSSPDGRISRYSHPAMLDAVVLALTGRTKPRIVDALARVGVAAVGLTGADAGLLRAKRKPVRRAVVQGHVLLVRDDHSGRIVSVDAGLIRVLLAAGFTPVVSPPASADDAGGGGVLNVDADRAAGALAGALGATRLIFLTAAAGVLRCSEDDTSVLAECVLMEDQIIDPAYRDGMHRKLVAAREALRAGVRQVLVGDGRVSSPVRSAIAGGGTRVTLAEPRL